MPQLGDCVGVVAGSRPARQRLFASVATSLADAARRRAHAVGDVHPVLEPSLNDSMQRSSEQVYIRRRARRDVARTAASARWVQRSESLSRRGRPTAPRFRPGVEGRLEPAYGRKALLLAQHTMAGLQAARGRQADAEPGAHRCAEVREAGARVGNPPGAPAALQRVDHLNFRLGITARLPRRSGRDRSKQRPRGRRLAP